MVSTLAFVFKITRTIIFFCSQESKVSAVKEFFLDQGIFLVKEIFLGQGIFSLSRKLSTKKLYLIKETFHKQRSFPQSINFPQKNLLDQGNFPHKKFYLINEIFYK